MGELFKDSPYIPHGHGLGQRQKRIGQRPRKNWPKAKNALAEGQSPPQELEVSPRGGLYLLVPLKALIRKADISNSHNLFSKSLIMTA